MKEAGVKPSMEVFNPGNLREVKNLIEKVWLRSPITWNLSLATAGMAE